MSRVAISEYAAKKLLIGDMYRGISAKTDSDLLTVDLVEGAYVVKVDDGTKKRNKKGLVTFVSGKENTVLEAKRFLSAGYSRILIEPNIEHDKKAEQYVSCDLVREGILVLSSGAGGVGVEEDHEQVVRTLISRSDFFSAVLPSITGVPIVALEKITTAMRRYNFSFVEINPYIESGDSVIFLDAAVEVDSSKLHLLPEWAKEHTQNRRVQSEAEKLISKLNDQSTASFSLTVFDKDASVFTLLSGGGASLVVLDSFVDTGLQAKVGNYGEYSGAPSQEETKIYTDVLLSLLFASSAPRKVLVIAGGVANFTDITTTFRGIIDSCRGYVDEFNKQKVLVRVRRGGPRQVEGLALLRAFFEENNIEAIVSDSDVPLSQVATDAKTFLEKTS